MTSNSQKGFSIVEVLLVVVLVALLGLLAWFYYDNHVRDKGTSETSTEQVDSVPEVNDASDLQGAEDYLNETDLDSELDTSELDSALGE